MIRALGFAGIALLALTQSALVATAEDMSQSEIREQLVGHQIMWWQDGGWQAGHLTLSPNGAAELSLDTPERKTDSGQWALRGSELCTKWTRMRNGLEKCYSITRGADGRFLTSGGNVFELREVGA